MSDDVVLRLQGVTKVYSGTVALRSADFEIRKGAVNVLVGENRAGKSTMMKLVAGVEAPTSGRILLDGREVHFADTSAAIAAGIGMLFQELNLFGNLSVAENVFANREIIKAGHIDHAEQERQTAGLMTRLQTGVDPKAMVEDLMIGQQQLVEIAKAVARDARILIMDEPTSALSAPEVEILFRVIADLKAKGVAIVYISHRLEELIRIGDYITVLRDGRVTGSRPMRDVDAPWIVRQMIGSDAKDFSQPGQRAFGPEALRLEEISLPRATGGYAVDRVSLTVRCGEILGVYGLMGAGRSELLECVIGRNPHARGRVFVDGRPVRERDVGGRIARGLALIPEDRQRDGLVPVLSVAENLVMASLRIRVNRVKMFVYMFSGFCAAIVGLVLSSELMAAHPATGETFEFNAIAAAVLGGASMSGGRGTVGGAVIGTFVIGILSDGLVMMGVSSFWQMVIKGVVIIAAVVVDQAQHKLQARVALQQMAQAA